MELTKSFPHKVNGYEIKPGAYLRGANLRGADLLDANLLDAYLWGADLEGAYLEGANVKGTILENKEESQDDKDLKIQQLEEELKKYKDTLKALLDG